jgi:hypothetical protein
LAFVLLARRVGGREMKNLQPSGRRRSLFGARVPVCVHASLLALGLVLSSNAAVADPIRPITAGDVFTGGDDTGFAFFGPGYSIMVSRFLDPIANCGPCISGSEFNVSTTLAVTDWTGRATVDGQTYESVYLRGLLDFTGGSVIVPDMAPGQSGPDGEGRSRALTNFIFTGALAGFGDPAGTPLFSTTLSGGGLVAVAFSNYPAESGIRVAQLDYHFDNLSATPEPGSLLMLGTGAAWIAARLRTRTRRGPFQGELDEARLMTPTCTD